MTQSTRNPATYPRVLLGVFVLYAAAWAYRPVDVKDWALENALAALFVVALVLSYRRFPLSNMSYTLIFVFLCLHTVGAHYTYSLVPYDAWAKNVAGTSINETFGFQRNHFDRLVHFLFGLLLSYPIRELFLRVARVRGFWGYYLPLDVTMSFSMIYELIEWAYAAIAGGDKGAAFLGTQGDEWDAHKDMALASLGALISMATVAAINWRFDRDFGDELRKSMTPAPDDQPLGEVRLAQLRQRP